VKVLLRDFEQTGIDRLIERLRAIRLSALEKVPGAIIDLTVKSQYANMGVKLSEDPRLVAYAMEAVRRAGIEPARKHIRGGTDGARLSFMGLLTPNIFTGGHNFHSKHEWIAVEDMVHCVETLIQLVRIWAEKG
jgi:tripeptide aminopeptidase